MCGRAKGHGKAVGEEMRERMGRNGLLTSVDQCCQLFCFDQTVFCADLHTYWISTVGYAFHSNDTKCLYVQLMWCNYVATESNSEIRFSII